MTEKETILFGIPVPSDNPVFLTIVSVHVLLGIICVVSGAVAMLSRKGGRTHIWSGRTYYWVLMLVLITVIPLSIMRWPHNNHLLALGVLSFSSAAFGRKLSINRRPGRTRLHTTLMGCSYILMLTAFYVDNGKNLPFWNQFSQLFFWLFPTALGVPIIILAIFRHRLNRNSF
jgi:uncharacterized membrane protein